MAFLSLQVVPFYIASTFLDFQVERNILRDEIVFPLNKKYRDELLNLKNIDLRWGILPSDSEEEHEEKVLKVCTDQIKRSNSNVILFIGDRYGWIPAEEKITPYLKGLDLPPLQQVSITALEIIYALHNRSEGSNIFIYIRKIANYDELDEKTKALYREDNQNLRILKDYLTANYPELIRTYEVIWDKSKNQIVKPENFKDQLTEDLGSTLEKYQRGASESNVVQNHLQKTLHHNVERNYLNKEVVDKLNDISKRGVLINNFQYDGTSVLMASVVSALRRTKKSVFYFSEDMKLNRSANIAELIQKPFQIRKPKNFQEAEKYFLDYMYLMNLHNPFETQVFLNINQEYNKVVVLLRNAIVEFIKSNKQKYLVCVDGESAFLNFLSACPTCQLLTSREVGVPQHIVYTKPFQKNEAKRLIKNLAADSSKEISETLIDNLLRKETYPKVRIFKDAAVIHDYINNGMQYSKSRPSYEEPEWVKQAFYLLEEQTDYEKIEDYSLGLGENTQELRSNLIRILGANLGETYMKFALSYIGFLNSKASPVFIQALISYTLEDEATNLKFAELQNLLSGFCDFDESGVRLQEDKADKLIFDYMRENKMHSTCLPFMISFYESQIPESFSSKDWMFFEEKLAFLLVEELCLDLEPINQLKYVRIYKEIMEKHVGIKEENMLKYEEFIGALNSKWNDSDYTKIREYLLIPHQMKGNVESFYRNWANRFHNDSKFLLSAFEAYAFINHTIHTDGKHTALHKPKNPKLMKEYEFFNRLLDYRLRIKNLLDQPLEKQLQE